MGGCCAKPKPNDRIEKSTKADAIKETSEPDSASIASATKSKLDKSSKTALNKPSGGLEDNLQSSVNKSTLSLG